MEGGILVTYGQDSDVQAKTTHIKLWEVTDVVDYSKLSKSVVDFRTEEVLCGWYRGQSRAWDIMHVPAEGPDYVGSRHQEGSHTNLLI